MKIQLTEIYACDGITMPASDALRNKEIVYRGRRASLAPEQGKSGHLMVVGNNRTSGAFGPGMNFEKDYRKMQSLIIEKARGFAGKVPDSDITTEMKERLLARGVDALVRYYGEENVDFIALSPQEQYIAVKHFAAIPDAVFRDVTAPVGAPVPPNVVCEIPASVLELVVPAAPALPAAPVKRDTSEEGLSIKSDLSDAEWDASVESLAKKTIEFAGIDQDTYDGLMPEQQDKIYAEGYQSFLKYSRLDKDGMSSLTGQAYLELVEKFAEPAGRNTAAPSNEPFETVEQTVSAVVVPVIEKIARKHRQRKAAFSPQLRSAHTIPDIYASGSEKKLELNPLDYLKLIQKYGDTSLKAELAMTLAPKR